MEKSRAQIASLINADPKEIIFTSARLLFPSLPGFITSLVLAFRNVLPTHSNGNALALAQGATESNNMALKGIAHFYRDTKKHIITCQTDHKCVLARNSAPAAQHPSPSPAS